MELRLGLACSLVCFLRLCLCSFVSAHDSHSSHDPVNPSSSGPWTASLEEPAALVQQALGVLADVNRDRVEKPALNKYELLGASELARQGLAPQLDIHGHRATRRASVEEDPSVNKTRSRAFVLPPQLAEAARILAESSPQVPSGNHSEVAAAVRSKYNDKANNDPRQPRHPEGRPVGPDAPLDRRDTGYWMVDMPQLGQSPFGPAGYQVWRNVKDYGAKSDGQTDDTAAINRAISDGGRCGPECGASTKVPAVVYFPPGNYLVSSSIIQYYNTQFLGDSHDVLTILAASSFVGLGVITSDVYISDNEEWLVSEHGQLPAEHQELQIDIRLTDPRAYVCGIHWQVAQATSLENIEFYMQYNSDIPYNTQQGIYMENGSGGFMADLTFVEGNFGAYFGNQQFTTSHLVFVNCKTAVQVHWDWAWTMHDFIIESCGNGLVILGNPGQGVGSLILLDSIIANMENGIVTSLVADHSTSFLLQNVGFFNVQRAVQDAVKDQVLVAGGSEVVLDSWGFGRINSASGPGPFVNGGSIPAMSRPGVLLGKQYDKLQPSLFTRRRPKYYDEPQQRIRNVKALGARGDGVSDDTAILNAILADAAMTSAIVYFPYGIYIVQDTLRVPIGSRIIGQAWSQIMGQGAQFSDEQRPRPVVQVGRQGDVGIIEIQDMMFTVTGSTAGAVVVEWNAKEASQGSVGLWDSHIRVGGAAGSNLQVEQCPKLSGRTNPSCKAASLLFHLTPGSTAYMENMWSWVADHDLERKERPQIDIYAGRGVLIESELAYLWGTASEHAVMYQYQLSQARNILMAMIQTESPYFQPTPPAPQPFGPGLFANDPAFADCSPADDRCSMSWAVRIVDSSGVYILGSGLYSWFYNYRQDCLATEACQLRGFEVRGSRDVWLYNLCTKAIVEMISPFGSVSTLARDNKNGFLSSILAWSP